MNRQSKIENLKYVGGGHNGKTNCPAAEEVRFVINLKAAKQIGLTIPQCARGRIE